MRNFAHIEFLRSEESIATNILADRLQRLEHAGLIEKVPGPGGREKTAYTATEKGKDLIPILFDMMLWSANHDATVNVTPRLLTELRRDKARVTHEVRRAGSVAAFLRQQAGH